MTLYKIAVEQGRQALVTLGPTFDVWLADASQTEVQAVAQIDTGAGNTSITERLRRRLGLTPKGAAPVHEAGREPITIPIIETSLRLQKGPPIVLKMGVIASMGDAHDVLIGRDILGGCRFVVDFIHGRFELQLTPERIVQFDLE